MNSPLDDLGDDLNRHARSLRGLAVALVRPGDADDLLQDAAVAALVSPPDEPTARRPWLASVLRRRAARRHRSERRRLDHEARAAEVRAAGDAAPAADVAGHRETIAALHQALLALPEPYGRVLLLRYFEDLTPTEIAARLAEPLATVKSRLRRGLELLRGLLERRSGGEWRAGLVSAFGLGKGASVSTVPAAGVLLMAMVTKVLVAAAVAGVLALWLWPDGGAPMPGKVERVEAGGGAVQVAADVGEAATPRELVVQADVATGGAAVPPGEGLTFVGRCVDEQGNGLAGVSVIGVVQPPNGQGDQQRLLGTTAIDGAFSITLPVRENHSHVLEFEVDGRCPMSGYFPRRKAGERVELGELMMPVTCVVRGQVVDDAGNAQGGVRMTLYPLRQASDEDISLRIYQEDCVTSVDGTFGFEQPVPAGDYSVWLGNRRALDGKDPPCRVEPGQREVHLAITVDAPPPPVRGIVVDESGVPVAGANVFLDTGRVARNVTTDGEGRFEVLPDPNGRRDICVEASMEAYGSALGEWHIKHPEELRLVLRSLPSIRLRVVDAASGAPIEHFVAWLLRANNHGNVPTVRETAHPGGVVRIPTTADEHLLVVDAVDDRYATTAMTPVQVVDGPPTEITIALHEPSQRRVVLRSGGAPVPDATIELVDCGGAPIDFSTEVWPLGQCNVHVGRIGVLLQRGITDSQGAMVLRGPRGPLSLSITGGGMSRQFVQPVQLDGQGDLVLDVERGATLFGTIEQPEIAERLAAECEAERVVVARRYGIRLERADGLSLLRESEDLASIARDGTFCIEGIPAGSWRVVIGGKYGRAVAEIRVAAGEHLERRFDASALAQVEVALTVRLDGVPFVGKVRWYGLHSADVAGKRTMSNGSCETDDRGNAVLHTMAGELWVEVYDGERSLFGRVDVPDGPRCARVLDMRRARVKLQFADAAGAPAAGARIRVSQSERLVAEEFSADEMGRVDLVLAEGSFEVSVLPRELSTREQRKAFDDINGWLACERQWLPLGTIQVTAGATAPQRMLLPPAWSH